MFKKTVIGILGLLMLLLLQNRVIANDSPKPEGKFQPANEYESTRNDMATLSQKERKLSKELSELLSKSKDIQNQLKELRAQMTSKAESMKEIVKQHPEYLPHHKSTSTEKKLTPSTSVVSP